MCHLKLRDAPPPQVGDRKDKKLHCSILWHICHFLKNRADIQFLTHKLWSSLKKNGAPCHKEIYLLNIAQRWQISQGRLMLTSELPKFNIKIAMKLFAAFCNFPLCIIIICYETSLGWLSLMYLCIIQLLQLFENLFDFWHFCQFWATLREDSSCDCE